MDIDFAFICDYAEVAGKINALGIGFDTIFAAQVPAQHPMFHLVAQIRANITEAGEKDLSIRLMDADGRDIIPPIVDKFTIQPPAAGTESTGRIGVAFNGVVFPRFGEYSLHVVIQGREMIRIPLRVAAPPSTA